MLPQTPEDWLPILAKHLDRDAPVLARLHSYTDGNAPLPEMGKNTRATWLAFQRKARTNFGGIACQSHANRIRVQSVRVGSDPHSEASKAARRIARDTRFSMVIGDAIQEMLTRRRGFIVVGTGEDGKAVITAESPDQFYADPDPVYPWKTRAALKVWRDPIEGTDYAMVWARGERQQFFRDSFLVGTSLAEKVVRSAADGGWLPYGPPEPYEGHPPVWILDRRNGKSLVEEHIDVIDRINLGKLQRMCIAAIQAFNQRALKKQAGTKLPEKDEKGNLIDWGKVFEPAPGALWDLPAGIDIWESQTVDIRPLLDGEKADARDFAAVTGTPVSMLQPDSANQSAGGADATTAQQVDACDSDIDRIKMAAAAAVAVALQIEGIDLGEDTVEVDFENPRWVTLAEKMDAYSKALASGMSPAVAQKIYLGWSQELIDEDDANRRKTAARAAVMAAAAAPPVAPPVDQGAQTPPGTPPGAPVAQGSPPVGTPVPALAGAGVR